MNVRLIFSAVFSVCIFFSCTPRKLIIQPIAQNTFWEQGREYIHHIDEQVEMMICFERRSLDRIVFYLEVTNKDSSTLFVDPGNIYYTFGGDTSETGKIENTRRFYAKDPDKEIDDIDKKIEQENSSYSTSVTVNAISGLLDAVGTIASWFSDDDDDEESTEEEEESYDPEQVRIEHEEKIETFENEKYYWQNETLRKTTLIPNSYAGGFIEFTLIEEISEFTVQVPVNSSFISFKFSQQWKKL